MPRRRALTEAQLATLFALPTAEADLIRHWTLERGRPRRHRAAPRRPQPARLRPAALCAPLSRPPAAAGRSDPEPALRFVADQLGVDPGGARRLRRPTPDPLRAARRPARAFGFATLAPAAAARIAGVAAAGGTRHHADLGGRRGADGRDAPAADHRCPGPRSSSAWSRRPGAGRAPRRQPAHRAACRHPGRERSMRCCSQGGHVDERAGLGPAAAGRAGPSRARPPGRVSSGLPARRSASIRTCAEASIPSGCASWRARAGASRAQHLRALSPLRRRATLVATVLDTTRG